MSKIDLAPASPHACLDAARATSGDDLAADRAAGAFVVASHEVLFEGASTPLRCDACDASLSPDDGDEGYCFQGRGLYVWAWGDRVKRDEVPLCARCASAIGMAALARWEIEEEEG